MLSAARRSDVPFAYDCRNGACGTCRVRVVEGQVRVEIEGHTDDQGSDDYNAKLSEARAKAVVDYLLSRFASLTTAPGGCPLPLSSLGPPPPLLADAGSRASRK